MDAPIAEHYGEKKIITHTYISSNDFFFVTNDTVKSVSQKLNRVPPRIDSHMDPGIEKL